MTDAFALSDSLEKNGYSKIQLNKLSTGHLCIECKLNDVEGRFILDTGAGGTVVDEKLSAKYGLETQPMDMKGTGAGGSGLHLTKSEGNELSFDSIIVDGVEVITMTLDHVNNAFEKRGIDRIDGVLGANFLTQFNALIDYSNFSLYLKN